MSDKIQKSLQRAKNLQRLYNEDKLMSTEFYKEMVNQIKHYLMKFLINKGYYKNGVPQRNFTQEDIDDCYTYVMLHITGTFVTKNGKQSFVKYDPKKGNLAGFVKGWCQGYSSSIITKQKKELKYSANRILILDDILINHTPSNFIEDDIYGGLEEDYDRELFLKAPELTGAETPPEDRFNLSKFEEYNLHYGISNTRRKSI